MLGNVLFHGAYTPVLKPGTGDLFQNCTVQVPASMANGQAMLTVAHFYLLGVCPCDLYQHPWWSLYSRVLYKAGANPAVEMTNMTLNVQ